MLAGWKRVDNSTTDYDEEGDVATRKMDKKQEKILLKFGNRLGLVISKVGTMYKRRSRCRSLH